MAERHSASGDRAIGITELGGAKADGSQCQRLV